jgi:chromosome segregation ATPase
MNYESPWDNETTEKQAAAEIARLTAEVAAAESRARAAEERARKVEEERDAETENHMAAVHAKVAAEERAAATMEGQEALKAQTVRIRKAAGALPGDERDTEEIVAAARAEADEARKESNLANRLALDFENMHRAARAEVERLRGWMERLIEAVDRAEPRKHSPWCNDVHEGGACEGDYLMARFMEEARAALGPSGADDAKGGG